MTSEEIIADEKYHTCGRCKWEAVLQSIFNTVVIDAITITEPESEGVNTDE